MRVYLFVFAGNEGISLESVSRRRQFNFFERKQILENLLSRRICRCICGNLILAPGKAGAAASVPARRQGPSITIHKRAEREKTALLASSGSRVLPGEPPKVERPSEGKTKSKPTHLSSPNLCLPLPACPQAAGRSTHSTPAIKKLPLPLRRVAGGAPLSLSSSSSRTPIKPPRPFPPIPFVLCCAHHCPPTTPPTARGQLKQPTSRSRS